MCGEVPAIMSKYIVKSNDDVLDEIFEIVRILRGNFTVLEELLKDGVSIHEEIYAIVISEIRSIE